MRGSNAIARAVRGTLAGAAATLALTLAMRAVQRVMDPPSQSEAPIASDAGQPTERLASRLVQLVRGTEATPEQRHAIGMAIHWTYGTAWGTAFGVATEARRLPVWMSGAALGLLVWLVGPMGLLPALNLSRRPRAVNLSRRLLSICLHQIYGWTAAATMRALSAR